MIERQIMKLLLKVKNGTPLQRELAMRQLTDKAREFGLIFNQILPLALEDQECHLLVKDFVKNGRAFEAPGRDRRAWGEGQEIISNLGLVSMISVLRPDLDNTCKYVRKTPEPYITHDPDAVDLSSQHCPCSDAPEVLRGEVGLATTM
ncbi:hypothetical protein SELMODRAFT_402965 [Selaginella moellendorffii]|uniref:Uncharacterized protein n=1 Tax=Selaginella moellendorffii TaxID=88036 RepID=D8QNM0_SELML|nr:hypothetical protein SELMODRAFT_402965 [Selaginella moellendorffii]